MLLLGDFMLYVAEFTKKKRLFQKHYIIDKNKIYITDKQKSKKKFLKSGIKNVVFGVEGAKDEIIGPFLEKAQLYDRDFALKHLENMIKEVIAFCNMTLPIEEVAIFSKMPEEIVELAYKYARVLTVVGDIKGKDMKEGVIIRYTKKMKAPPKLIISEGERKFSSVFKVPVIDLGENNVKNSMTMSIDTASFETDILPFDISMGTLLYFLKKGENIAYKATSYRKKSPDVFTFG